MKQETYLEYWLREPWRRKMKTMYEIELLRAKLLTNTTMV